MYGFYMENLMSLHDEELEPILRHIEQWQNANPADRSLDAMWSAFRNERDYRLSKRD
jgi:hypothetical protein